MSWKGFGLKTIQFAGLSTFVRIFSDRKFIAALSQTARFSICTVVGTMVIALALALLLNSKIKFRNFFRASIFFPHVASIVAVGAVWKAMFMKTSGPINAILQCLGVPEASLPGWLSTTKWALTAVIIVQIWKNMGYYMVIYLAALQGVNRELYEAASIDGSNAFHRFRYITFPLLTPTHFFVLMMLVINSFKTFDLVYVLTEGGPGYSTTLISNYIYDQAFLSWNYGVASASSLVVFLIVGTITVIQFLSH